MLNVEIARVAHEVNRAYCEALGDTTQVPFDDAPAWQRASAIAGVEFHRANPDATPADSHNSWLAEKGRDGWRYGPVKDPETKEHPCFLPYGDLPAESRAKDYLFRGVVHALIREEAELVGEAQPIPPAEPPNPRATIAYGFVCLDTGLDLLGERGASRSHISDARARLTGASEYIDAVLGTVPEAPT